MISEQGSSLFVCDNNIHYRVFYDDILSIKKIKSTKKLSIFTMNSSYSMSANIKDLQLQLSDAFLQLNKSTIINLNNVVEFSNKEIPYCIFANNTKELISSSDYYKIRKAINKV